MLEDEQDIYYPKFNVEGLLRGAVEDRMRAYSIAISSGIITPNEARQKENLAPFPPEEGADHPTTNGSNVRLKDVGAAYRRNNPSQEQQTQQPNQEEQTKPAKSDEGIKPDEEQEEKDNKKHTERKKQRKSERRGK